MKDIADRHERPDQAFVQSPELTVDDDGVVGDGQNSTGEK